MNITKLGLSRDAVAALISYLEELRKTELERLVKVIEPPQFHIVQGRVMAIQDLIRQLEKDVENNGS